MEPGPRPSANCGRLSKVRVQQARLGPCSSRTRKPGAGEGPGAGAGTCPGPAPRRSWACAPALGSRPSSRSSGEGAKSAARSPRSPRSSGRRSPGRRTERAAGPAPAARAAAWRGARRPRAAAPSSPQAAAPPCFSSARSKACSSKTRPCRDRRPDERVGVVDGAVAHLGEAAGARMPVKTSVVAWACACSSAWACAWACALLQRLAPAPCSSALLQRLAPAPGPRPRLRFLVLEGPSLRLLYAHLACLDSRPQWRSVSAPALRCACACSRSSCVLRAS
jgi:hypothetical protein